MDIQDLVTEKIKNSDYDGLFDSSGECACVGDIPCGEVNTDCTFGYFMNLTDEQKVEFDFMIGLSNLKKEDKNDGQ